MDNQKVVVILLLITIILSVASVVLFMSAPAKNFDVPQRTVVDNPISQSSVQFEIVESGASGGAG